MDSGSKNDLAGALSNIRSVGDPEDGYFMLRPKSVAIKGMFPFIYQYFSFLTVQLAVVSVHTQKKCLTHLCKIAEYYLRTYIRDNNPDH